MGLDFIVRPDGTVVLVELQHHFGRSGLLRLFSPAGQRHRQITRRLRGLYGTSPAFFDALRKVCSSKILTYRLLPHFQPSSFVYYRWGRRVESWLEGLAGDYVLLKPPRGSCGRGILVFRKEDFRRDSSTLTLSSSVLLQEYAESRHLLDESGRPHMGCIRHIVHVYSDSSSLGFIHLPSYWRVADAPFDGQPPRMAFTANISTGAYPLPVEGAEAGAIRETAEKVVIELVGKILNTGRILRGPSEFVTPGGDLRAGGERGQLTTASPLGK
jgi:hypothetical protein